MANNEQQFLSDERLKVIFNEFKNNDKSRDFITFNDFETAIKTYNIQLMRGLSQDDPDFHTYCRELFMMICHNIAQVATEQSDKEKSSRLIPSSRPSNFQRNNSRINVVNAKNDDNGKNSRQPRQVSNSQKRNNFGLKKEKTDNSQVNRKITAANKVQQRGKTTDARKNQEQQKREKHLNQIREDRLKAQQKKKNFGDKNSKIPIQSLKLDFETFLSNYKQFATLRKIVYFLNEKIQLKEKVILREKQKRGMIHKENSPNIHVDAEEIQMKSAKFGQKEATQKSVVNIYLDQEDMEFGDEDRDDENFEYERDYNRDDNDMEFDSSSDDISRDSQYIFGDNSFYQNVPKSKSMNPLADMGENPLNELNDDDPEAFSHYQESCNMESHYIVEENQNDEDEDSPVAQAINKSMIDQQQEFYQQVYSNQKNNKRNLSILSIDREEGEFEKTQALDFQNMKQNSDAPSNIANKNYDSRQNQRYIDKKITDLNISEDKNNKSAREEFSKEMDLMSVENKKLVQIIEENLDKSNGEIQSNRQKIDFRVMSMKKIEQEDDDQMLEEFDNLMKTHHKLNNTQSLVQSQDQPIAVESINLELNQVQSSSDNSEKRKLKSIVKQEIQQNNQNQTNGNNKKKQQCCAPCCSIF